MKRTAYLFCCAAMLAATSSRAGAATYEEVKRLDAAYPPGSVVICRSDLPGDSQMLRHTLTTTRGTVVARRNNITDFDVAVTWLTEGETGAGMTLTFRSTERAEKKGVYVRIDPDSMSLSLPGAREEEKKTVLDGFRDNFARTEHFGAYSETEITDFPSYVVRKPGEPPALCHKETAGS